MARHVISMTRVIDASAKNAYAVIADYRFWVITYDKRLDNLTVWARWIT